MKLGSVIHRYIFRELIPPFLISLSFLMFVFLMTTLLDITDLMINYQVGFATILMMVAYSIPSFLQFIIPMSVMIAVLLTFLRMSSDNEIIALKAGGMSVYTMLPPVIVFCLFGCLLTAFMAIYGMPWGRLSAKSMTDGLNTTSLTALLKERTFNDSFKNRTLYVTKIDPRQNTLTGIFIEDRSTKQVITIVAPRGRLMEDTDKGVFHLQLEKGRINWTDIKTKTVNATDFDKKDFRLDLNRTPKSSEGPKSEKDMSLSELQEYIRTAEKKDERYYLALIAFHNKFSIPFACFALGLLAVPLGVQSKSAQRSFGIGLGLFFFLGYYLILSAGEVYGRTGSYPPLLGMWAPNIIMGGIGGFLLIRCARERDIGINRLLLLFSRHPRLDSNSEETPSAPVNP